MWVLPSASLRELVLRAFLKKGWKYFVLWHDRQGYGLEAVTQTEWQTATSRPFIQR